MKPQHLSKTETFIVSYCVISAIFDLIQFVAQTSLFGFYWSNVGLEHAPILIWVLIAGWVWLRIPYARTGIVALCITVALLNLMVAVAAVGMILEGAVRRVSDYAVYASPYRIQIALIHVAASFWLSSWAFRRRSACAEQARGADVENVGG